MNRRHPGRGLTLLELLVVLAILGLATAGVSLALRTPGSAQLEEDAQRLAALLEAGRADSRRSGLPVRWQASAEGFAFEGLQGPALPQTWKHAGLQAQVEGGESLLLGPEPVIGPQRVWLSRPAQPGPRWAVDTDGARPFAAHPATAEAP